MKYRIRKTGEIVDVISYSGLTTTERNKSYDHVDYIDSKGNEIIHAKLNLYWDLEPIDESKPSIDWEQRRYEIAKEIISTIAERGFKYPDDYVRYNADEVARKVVNYVDKLIIELEK